MVKLKVGCADLPPRMAQARYFAALQFLETTLCVRQVPSDKVLRRWRAPAPARGDALVAPEPLRATQPVASLAGEPTAFAAAAGALDAAAVVFRAPDVTPSEVGRDVLRRLFAEHAPAERFPGCDRVWQPGG